MIRKMTQNDWTRVSEIYTQGIESGIATYTTQCPTYEEFDKSHLNECRYVYEENGIVIGWIALSPTSPREPYRGVVETSIYVDNNHHRKGVGTALMNEVIRTAPEFGFWTIYSVALSINTTSLEFHRKCGFREIGYRERVAKDRFGVWQNQTLFEYRLATE